MIEDDIYKVAVLRCPACERLIESEIECIQPTKTGDKVLDSCPRCGFLGDFKIVSFLLALLFVCSYSWGACRTNTYASASGFATHPSGYNSIQCISSPAECSYCIQGNCSGSGWGSSSCQEFLAKCELSLRGGCPSVYQAWPGYYTDPVEGCPYKYGACSREQSGCNYRILCDTKAEADSIACIQNPSLPNCPAPCDSTKWECTTTTETSQTTVASDDIVCFKGDCFGTTYCEYITSNTTTCTNECGGITTEKSEIPIRYEGHCNEDNLLDDTECTNVRCISFEKTKSYSLYKLCASREIVNGERKFLPRIVGGGKGSCASNGYPESNGDSLPTSPDSLKVPEECFTMGLNCPASDSTDYASEENRNPENGCNCEKYDGMSHISRIVCPDGSVSVFFGSCNDWNNPPFSSSSFEPPESSSSSENPASSGGGDLVGDWINYSQGEQIKELLGVIAVNTAKESQINNVNSINVALDDYTTSNDDVDVPFNRVDSIFDPSLVIDTAGLKNAIFGRVTEENTILDTLLHSGGKCPCFTFFSGGGSQAQIIGTHISFPKIEFDFSNFHGFNLCNIIQVVVTALASVVAFFIGFAIFKNVSQ